MEPDQQALYHGHCVPFILSENQHGEDELSVSEPRAAVVHPNTDPAEWNQGHACERGPRLHCNIHGQVQPDVYGQMEPNSFPQAVPRLQAPRSVVSSGWWVEHC